MYSCISPGSLGLSWPYEPYFEAVKNLGINALDFALSPEDDFAAIKRELETHDLRFASQFLPAKPWHASDAEFDAWLKAEGRQLVVNSVELGCLRFGVYIVPGSDSLDYGENFSWHVNRLSRLAALVGEFGATLSLEYVAPKTSREKFRYPFIWNLQQTLDLCEATGQNVGAVLDSWHWHASLGTIQEICNLPGERIGIVHINDAPAGIPIEQLMDLERRLPTATNVIDIGAFLEAVRATGYNGPIIPEPFDATLHNLDAAEVLECTADSINAAFAAVPHPRLPEKMRVLVLGGNDAKVSTTAMPHPVGNQVVIKMHAAMICGSNVSHFLADKETVNGGHEGAGEVVAVAHSTRLKVGDRVALAPLNACGYCRHCLRGDVILCDNRPSFAGNFAEYTRVADNMCIPLPDDIDYEKGSLLGCGLGPAYGALTALGVRAFDKVLITGLGPVGLGATALATFLGADVAVVDPEPYRQKIAAELGASCVLDPIQDGYELSLREYFGAAGVLKAIECSGRGEVQRQLIDIAGKGAHICFIGENQKTIAVSPSNDFIRKGLRLQGIWHMNMNDAPQIIEFLRRAPEKTDLLVTHRFAMHECRQAFETFVSRQAVKVVINPAQERATSPEEECLSILN
jgi:threonine dehydrogenase-like Zn-dependent dehydrogenase/sugar phosphate isomerase/epimerase